MEQSDQPKEQPANSDQGAAKSKQKPKNSAPIYWYRLKIHEVKNQSYFEGHGLRVHVGEESVFKPYITSITSLPQKEEESTLSKGYTFAQPWLPMRKANEVFLKRPRTPRKHLGAYLVDGEQRWWVTSAWQEHELGASSTHLASFIIAQDEQPPTIGSPLWDMVSPLGPRLMVPIKDNLSGLSKVKLLWAGKEVGIEVQRSWQRLIYRPLEPLKEGTYDYTVIINDRSGNESKHQGALNWPPKTQEVMSLQDPIRKALEPL